MELDSELTPPLRYGIVNPGLYRGSYPTLRNFRFLSRLQLKTMLCLSPESPSFDIESFCEMAGTRTIHIQINRTNALNESLQATLLNAINICIDANNHPIYVHCLDGRRITSLLILLLRRIQGWSPIPTFSEYWRFQVSSHTLIPTAEVEKTTKELEKFATEIANVVMPDSIPRWLWEGDRGAVVSGVKLVSKPQAK